MALRVHFSAEDLSRIHMVSSPDPAWEITLSVTQLTSGRARAVFDPWRAAARARLRSLGTPHLRLLRRLAPPVGDFPDFLTPARPASSLASTVDAVLSTPRERLRRDLSVLAGPPGPLRLLADADRTALAALGDALHGYHRAAIAPLWPRLRTLVDADRARRARALVDEGVEGLLRSFAPTLRWSSPVLEADYPVDRDLHLGGRGLLLVPSVFCWRTPVTLIDPELRPVLVYPVPRGPGWWLAPADRGAGATDRLACLLGHSRAAALRVIEDGCTTSELARRIGVTPPTASQQAAILRETGLIVSVRSRNTVLHTLTPLGTDLLDANPQTARSPAVTGRS
ncbi:ArsR/SmtB family transcription factor [Streptomyces fragilis]|uniref:Winged helix-turn-helix domain-containing protein n=1 Tax=Streptomyces fragilis TaxID=67301 RepID=A0ABV2YRM8_9ACTN|nr:winged helix-turn-helix domain-containing protein [Streptomyces fragilis]